MQALRQPATCDRTVRSYRPVCAADEWLRRPLQPQGCVLLLLLLLLLLLPPALSR